MHAEYPTAPARFRQRVVPAAVQQATVLAAAESCSPAWWDARGSWDFMHNLAALGMTRRRVLEGPVTRGRWLTVVGAVLLVLMEAAATAAARRPPIRSTDGAHLYRTECAPCHGPTGRGNGPDAALFSPRPRNLHTGFLDRYDTMSLVRRVLDATPLALALDLGALQTRADDVETIVAYVQRLPTIDWPLVAHGEEIYVDHCEPCHGRYGNPGVSLPAAVEPPRDLSAPGVQRAYTDGALLETARHGRKGVPAAPGLESDADGKALVAYVRLLSPGHATYERYCASCHGDDGIGAGGSATASGVKRPTIVFDRAYFATHEGEHLRVNVWHMLAEHKPEMPHFRGTLTEPQVRAIVEYLKLQ
jgi:mono/diheme cytochrome c family protein